VEVTVSLMRPRRATRRVPHMASEQLHCSFATEPRRLFLPLHNNPPWIFCSLRCFRRSCVPKFVIWLYGSGFLCRASFLITK
jgi:hypothetical protein